MYLNKNVLIIPHVGKSGGAGIYNNELIESLKKKSPIKLADKYYKDYFDNEELINETSFNYN